MKTTITETEEARRGQLLADALGLKSVRNQHGAHFDPPRYQTNWGTKTALGLFRTVARIVEDGE